MEKAEESRTRRLAIEKRQAESTEQGSGAQGDPTPEPRASCPSCGLAVDEEDVACAWCGAGLANMQVTKPPPPPQVPKPAPVTPVARSPITSPSTDSPRPERVPVGFTNGLSKEPRGTGRTNGLARATTGRTIGMTNGLASTVRALRSGMTNGLTNGSGFTNGLGAPQFQREAARSRWKVYLIPVLAGALLLMPLFSPGTRTGGGPITIDGDASDWSSPLAHAQSAGGPNPNVDVVRFGIADNVNGLAILIEVAGSALQGGSSPPIMDAFHVFLDTDGDVGTGYTVDGLGADRLLRISGWGGSVNVSASTSWSVAFDPTDWRGWSDASSVYASTAAAGGRIETQIEWPDLGDVPGRAFATVHARGFDGATDRADFALNVAGGSLAVRQTPVAPALVSGGAASLLRLDLAAVREEARWSGLTVTLTGSAPFTATTQLRILDSAGALVDARTPQDRRVSFQFGEIPIPPGGNAVFDVVADVTGPSGATLGALVANAQDVAAQGSLVTLLRESAARDVGYLGTAPSDPQIDGGFDEWVGAGADPTGDVTRPNRPDVDIEGFAAQSRGNVSYFFAEVTGRFFRGTWVVEPNGLATSASTPLDADRDGVPDALDPLPFDFNNDGIPDASALGDLDADGIVDHPWSGADLWLNTTIPATFPAPYAGRSVSAYVGPVERPYHARDDILRVFADIDNATSSGYSVGGLGADRMIELAGASGLVRATSVFAFAGAFPGQWSWVRTADASFAVGYNRTEFASPENLTRAGSRLYVEIAEPMGGRDAHDAGSRGTRGGDRAPSAAESSSFDSAPMPTHAPWNARTGTRASSLVDGSSNAISTEYNHQRKVVRAGDVPVDGPCNLTNSDGCWYAVFYDQLSEAASTTAASTQTITKGSNPGGGFPGGISSEDGVYVQYQEGLEVPKAEIGYRSSTSSGVNFPKTRTWDGSAWGAETQQATSGSPPRAVQMAWSPTALDTRIIVTQSDDGWLDAFVCVPSCTVTNDIGQVWSTAPTTPEIRFDIAYEDTSGEALLVYGILSTDAARDIAYKTYVSGSWGAEQYLDDTGQSSDVQYSLIKLASRAGSDQIGLIGGDDTTDDVNAWIWDGGAWTSPTEIAGASARTPNNEEIAIAWEANSGHLLAVASESSQIRSREYTTSWQASVTYAFGAINPMEWLSLKANPVGDDMILGAATDNDDLGTAYWTGSAWANGQSHDGEPDVGGRCFDFAWEPTGSKGLLVYGSSFYAAGQITRRTFTAPNTWGAKTTVTMGTGEHPWIQLRTATSATGTTLILGAVIEATANDLGGVRWDGTTFTVISTTAFTADTATSAYESFELEYQALSDDRLDVRHDFSAVPAGDSYTLKVKGYRDNENIWLQVLTLPGTWNNRVLISATTNQLYTYTLTTAEYNSGAPSIRFFDTVTDGVQSNVFVDLSVVTSNSHWDRVVLTRSTDTSGSTWGTQVILASGRAADSPLLYSYDSAEPSIAIDASGFLHVVWVSAASTGNQGTLNRVRYTKTTVAYPIQSEIAAAGNWESVTSVDEAPATKVGAFNIGTGSIGTTVPVAVGFQPKVVLFWWSGRTTSTDSASTATHQRGFGVAVTTTDRRSVCSQSQDNQPAGAGDKGHHDAAAICSLTTAGAFDGLADLASMNADGFTLVIDDAFATDLRVHYLALGGASLTDAKTGMFIESATTGNQDITTVGFQPDAVILFSSRNTFDPPGADVDSSIMVGFAAGPGNPNDVVLTGGSNDASDPTQTATYHRAGESIAVTESAVTVLSARAEVDAWLSNGFSLNWNEVIGVRRFHYLALKGGNYLVGDLTTSTTAGATITESGFGFSPQASLFLSHNKVQSTVDTLQAHDEMSIGAFSSTGDRGAHCVIDEDNVPDSDVGTAVEHDEVYCNLDGNTAIEGLMGVQTVASGGFTLVMDDPDPAASFVGYMALGGFGGGASYPGYMPTVSTDSSNNPHVAWSGSKTAGTVYYRNKAAGAWQSIVPLGTTYTGLSVDVAPANNYVSLTAATGSWYDGGWQFRKKITIDHRKVGATVTDFPVLISHTDANLQATAQADGDDILFTSSDGRTKLSHEIERYTGGTGELIAFVKVPAVSSVTGTVLYMYYGNAAVLSQQDPVNVWDANYKGVWHLKEATGAINVDSTINANHGTPTNGPTATTGKINGALDFDGVDDHVNVGDMNDATDGVSTMTVSAWAKPDALGDWKTVVEKRFGGGNRWYMQSDATGFGGTDDVRLAVNNGGSIEDFYTTANMIAVGQWGHWVMVFDGTLVGNTNRLKFYFDGVQRTLTQDQPGTVPATTPSNANSVMIGREEGGTVNWNGPIDDVRISNVARSAAWISTEFNNQNAPATFYALGGQERPFEVHYVVCKSLATNCDAPSEFTKYDDGAGFDAVDSNVASHTSSFAEGPSVAIGTTETILGSVATALPAGDNIVIATVAISTIPQGTSSNIDIAAGNLKLKRGAAVLASNQFRCRTGGTDPSDTVFPTNYCFLLAKETGAPANPTYDVTALASATGMNAEVKILAFRGVTGTFQDGGSVVIGPGDTTVLSHSTTLAAGNNLVIAAFQIENTGWNHWFSPGNVRIKRGAATLASNQFEVDLQSEDVLAAKLSTGYLLLARDVGAPANPTYDMTALPDSTSAMNGEVKIFVIQEDATVKHALSDGGSVAIGTSETTIGTASTTFGTGDNVVIASHHYRNEAGADRTIVAGNDRIRQGGFTRTSNQFDVRLADWGTTNGGIGNPASVWRHSGADSSPSYDSTALVNAAGTFNGETKIAVIHVRDPDPRYPSLATTYEANGDLWVAYEKDVDATTRAIYARSLDYPGGGWQAVTTIDSLAGTIFTRPSIGIDRNNDAHALYTATASPQVYYSKRTGGTWGARTAVEQGTSDNPTLVVRAPNDATYGGDMGGLYWQRFSNATYFYYQSTGIPEYEALAIPIAAIVLLGLWRRSSRSARRSVQASESGRT